MNPQAEVLVAAVRVHCDTVLAKARDRWGSSTTPLLADGLSVDGHEPVIWRQHGSDWILSNPASQQNFLRVLCGLESLCGLSAYGDAAREITAYVLRHMRFGDLIWWGGHCAADLQHDKLVFCTDGSPYPRHELERCFPFYALMYDVDPGRTREALEAFWAMHISDWRTLSFNRHNVAVLPSAADAGSIWNNAYSGDEVTSRYFTFMPAGMDLVHAATQLSVLTGDARPLAWARRLVARYFIAGDGETGLPAYLYNASYRQARTEGRPERVDRASSQFGMQLGRAVEERSIWTAAQQHDALYCFIALLEMSRATKDAFFGDAAVAALIAFARHSFDRTTGLFNPILTDGTVLTGKVLERSGYFGEKGDVLMGKAADAVAFLAYASAYRHSRDGQVWAVARSIAARLKLGDIGSPGGDGMCLTNRAGSADPKILLATVALFKGTGRLELLRSADQIAANIITKRLHNGLFAVSGKRYSRIDAIEPLALLHLAETHEGQDVVVPAWFGGSSRFHAHYDGKGRTTDTRLFYQ